MIPFQSSLCHKVQEGFPIIFHLPFSISSGGPFVQEIEDRCNHGIGSRDNSQPHERADHQLFAVIDLRLIATGHRELRGADKEENRAHSNRAAREKEGDIAHGLHKGNPDASRKNNKALLKRVRGLRSQKKTEERHFPLF